jgi:hypothetical protein
MKTRLPLSIPAIPYLLFLSSCYLIPSEGTRSYEIAGYRPIYGPTSLQKIELTESRAVTNPGKIYSYKKYLLVNELNEGIHLFDNLDPKNPKPIGFIRIVGNSDMAIKDDVLYADHMGNIVALRLNEFSQIEETGSLPLQQWDLGLPPPRWSHFECVDPSKGLVVEWTNVTLKDPSCYAN